MFNFMGTSTFLTLGAVDFAREGCVILFSAIVVLRHSWVHVSTSNSGNGSTIVERMVNEQFGF